MPFPVEMTKRLGKKRRWTCEVCGRRWVDGFLMEGHHKIPTHQGGQDVEENFQLLCIECHEKAHRELARKDNNSANIILSRLRRTKGRWK